MIRTLALAALFALPLPLAAQTLADAPLAGLDVRDLAMAEIMAAGPADACAEEIRVRGGGEACAAFRAHAAEVRRTRAPALAWCRADEAKRRANPVVGEVLPARPECGFIQKLEADLEARFQRLDQLAREQRR